MKLNEKYNPESFVNFIQDFLPEDFNFKEEDITYIADVDLPEQNFYILVDNAESIKDTADDRAIAVEGWRLSFNRVHR